MVRYMRRVLGGVQMLDDASLDGTCSMRTNTRYYMVPHKMSTSKRLFGSGVSVWFRHALRKKTKRSWRTEMWRHDRRMALDDLDAAKEDGGSDGE